MASIRARLTTAYAATLVGTVAVLGAVLYAGQREATARSLSARARADADSALQVVDRVAADGIPTTTNDTLIGVVVTAALRTRLELVPDYVLVLDSTSRTLYNSAAVRQLDPDDQVRLSQVAMRLRVAGPPEPVALSDRQLLLGSGAPAGLPPGLHTAIYRVVAGVDMSTVEAFPRELLATEFIITPLVILISVIGAGDELRRLSETLNEMIARLETSFGGLRRFTADASHELKTPLAVLRADVERAITAPPHSTEQLVALEEALQETRRMADLVDSLLTLARADEGRFDIFREPVALDAIVREVGESAVILGEDAGLTVSILVLEPAVVRGDATRLRQLFMNLVMNAIKYTPRGGRIDISLSHRLDGVTFSVRDTGIGIAASDLPYIFERFWRADRARSRASERGGFGLGLAIGQWIAQAHGGSITVTSRLGRGSVFTVHLPAATDEPARADAETHAAAAQI